MGTMREAMLGEAFGGNFMDGIAAAAEDFLRGVVQGLKFDPIWKAAEEKGLRMHIANEDGWPWIQISLGKAEILMASVQVDFKNNTAFLVIDPVATSIAFKRVVKGSDPMTQGFVEMQIVDAVTKVMARPKA